MTHEYETCSCVLCLTVRRVVHLLYDPECSGAVQRKGVSLLREVHAQLLDVADAGSAGAATSAPPERSGQDLPSEGEKQVGQKVKEEPVSEAKKPRQKDGIAPVVDASDDRETSPSADKAEKDSDLAANLDKSEEEEKIFLLAGFERRRSEIEGIQPTEIAVVAAEGRKIRFNQLSNCVY